MGNNNSQVEVLPQHNLMNPVQDLCHALLVVLNEVMAVLNTFPLAPTTKNFDDNDDITMIPRYFEQIHHSHLPFHLQMTHYSIISAVQTTRLHCGGGHCR